ncbi:hypothetical protein [Photobacterium atrarenae]|uniref:Uncharacterized protein n=1 Tax=Photobacterium atrarenae TaxID=865757 RepID=A0ABY5GDA4_9GAMM|nr:hypothetical protein [Photobacterium atrarenae]UTV27215.1 hypothetical protein NNL38_12865 [Photobacterium atrarenae]
MNFIDKGLSSTKNPTPSEVTEKHNLEQQIESHIRKENTKRKKKSVDKRKGAGLISKSIYLHKDTNNRLEQLAISLGYELGSKKLSSEQLSMLIDFLLDAHEKPKSSVVPLTFHGQYLYRVYKILKYRSVTMKDTIDEIATFMTDNKYPVPDCFKIQEHQNKPNYLWKSELIMSLLERRFVENTIEKINSAYLINLKISTKSTLPNSNKSEINSRINHEIDSASSDLLGQTCFELEELENPLDQPFLESDELEDPLDQPFLESEELEDPLDQPFLESEELEDPLDQPFLESEELEDPLDQPFLESEELEDPLDQPFLESEELESDQDQIFDINTLRNNRTKNTLLTIKVTREFEHFLVSKFGRVLDDNEIFEHFSIEKKSIIERMKLESTSSHENTFQESDHEDIDFDNV